MKDEHAAMSPAMRMTKGLCPECAVSLEGLDPVAHGQQHWSWKALNDPLAVEARVRMKMLENFAISLLEKL